MKGQDYFQAILSKQQLAPFQEQRLMKLRDRIEEALRKRHGSEPRIRYGGSYAKKTMIRQAFDLDIVIYFPCDDDRPLKELFLSVRKSLWRLGYSVHTKTVALQITMDNAFHVDVVPARAYDETFQYASLFRSDKQTPMKTSLDVHIEAVRNSGARDIIKLMKVWRIRRSVPEWKTFALEQLVISALRDGSTGDLAADIIKVLEYIESHILDVRLEDPANSNNIIEIPQQLRKKLHQNARVTLNTMWRKIIPAGVFG